MSVLRKLICVAIVCMLTACSNGQATTSTDVHILVPMGATSLSMLGLYDDPNIVIDTVDGIDAITAELSKDSSAYDIIIAPINVGAKLIAEGRSEYVLSYVVTWGNLYIVGSDESALSQAGNFAAFGELAVPQKVLTSSINVEALTPEITYFNSVNDVQQQLLTQKANVGLLAEPAATATIAKAKEKGIALQVLVDLQKAYKEKQGMEEEGYPQAALFIKKDVGSNVTACISKAEQFINDASNDEGKIAEAITIATTDKLGVPSIEIIQKTWERQNIRFVEANQVKTEIEMFLSQFGFVEFDNLY